MASDLEAILNRISEKSRFLTERYKVVSRRKEEAEERVAELEKTLRDRDRQIQLMSAELEYLKVSSALAPTAESVNTTRTMIRELIRDIDRCIADLND